MSRSRRRRHTGRRPHSRTTPNRDRVGTGAAIRLSAETWNYICEHGHEIEIVHIAEDEGMAALITWLDEHGLSWSPET